MIIGSSVRMNAGRHALPNDVDVAVPEVLVTDELRLASRPLDRVDVGEPLDQTTSRRPPPGRLRVDHDLARQKDPTLRRASAVSRDVETPNGEPGDVRGVGATAQGASTKKSEGRAGHPPLHPGSGGGGGMGGGGAETTRAERGRRVATRRPSRAIVDAVGGRLHAVAHRSCATPTSPRMHASRRCSTSGETSPTSATRRALTPGRTGSSCAPATPRVAGAAVRRRTSASCRLTSRRWGRA